MEEISSAIKIIKMIKQVMDAARQNMKREFGEMNLTGPQGMLIGILARYGEMKISDLSEKLGLSNSNVSGIIDRLEEQGLVERIRSKEDRRVVFARVTEEFKRNSQKHFSQVEKKFEILMSKATPEELDKIVEGIETLKKVMDRQNEI